MAEWGRNYGGKLVKALGFTHKKTPCAATLHTVFRNIDKQEFECKLAEWAEGVMSSDESSDDTCEPEGIPEPEGVSLDGKTLRGSLKQGNTYTVCCQSYTGFDSHSASRRQQHR
jgi:hypothetical protein